jgi:hypothetical protein
VLLRSGVAIVGAVENFLTPLPGEAPGATALVPYPSPEYLELDAEYPFLAPFPEEKGNRTNRW